jgi:hypothetical protein
MEMTAAATLVHPQQGWELALMVDACSNCVKTPQCDANKSASRLDMSLV